MFWQSLGAVFAVSILGIAAFGAGRWLERLLPCSFSRLDRFACCWIGGFGVLGTALFLIGQIAFTPFTILLVLAAGAAAGIRPILRVRKGSTLNLLKRDFPALPAIIVAAVLLLTGVAAFADVTGDWGSDAVAYHLLGPKVWLREGVIRPVLDSSHTAFPPTPEVIYGALMWLGGPHGPGLFAVLSLLMFSLAVASVCIRAGTEKNTAWWAVAFVASMPAVYIGAHSAFVDVFYASFVLAAARIGLDTESSRDFLAFGLMCGFAIATKYTGLLALTALLVAGGFAAGRNGGDRRSVLRGSAIVLAAALIVGAPAYLRNWMMLGCPIYPPPPLLAKSFPVKYLSPEAVSGFHAYIYHRGTGLGRGLRAYFSLPFNLTYHTANFHGAGGVGLYALALGPFGIIASRRNNFARALAVLALLLTTLWFLTQQESRFLIHVYAIGAIFGALGWQYVRSAGSRYSSVLCALVIALSLAYGSFMIATSRADEIHSLFSVTFAERWRHERIPFLESFRYLNSDPSVQKVLILDRSVPPFYCEKSYLKITGQWEEQVLSGIRSAHDALEHLGELHVSHILDVSSEVSVFQVPANTPGLELVFERQDQRIYRVTSGH